MRYRDHRGGLQDSLATTAEVFTRADLVAHLNREGAFGIGRTVTDDDIRVEPYGGDDKRIGWRDVHIVVLDGYGVLGFVETDLRDTAQTAASGPIQRRR
jgi:hypothetical protein